MELVIPFGREGVRALMGFSYSSAFSDRWPALNRLLSVMPGVRRSTAEKVKLERWPSANAAPWIPEGIYPGRVMVDNVEHLWEPEIKKIPAELVVKRPADWVILEKLEDAPSHEQDITRLIVQALNNLHRTGGYLIVHLWVPSKEPEPEIVDGIIRATPEWWLTQIDLAATVAGFNVEVLWQSMFTFAVLRNRVTEEHEKAALASWGIDNVLMLEARPLSEVATDKRSKKKSWWRRLVSR